MGIFDIEFRVILEISSFTNHLDVFEMHARSLYSRTCGGRGRGSPPRRFLTGPHVLPGPVEALIERPSGILGLPRSILILYYSFIKKHGKSYHGVVTALVPGGQLKRVAS